MIVKDTELFVALGAIAKLIEETSDGQDVLSREIDIQDLSLVDAYIEQVTDKAAITGEDILMAAIAVVKAKINELKETKE